MSRTGCRISLLIVLLAGSCALAALPPPEPSNSTDVIRVWGSAELQPLVERWEEGFKKNHLDAQFATHMAGSDSGLPGLYTRCADIAFLGRAATDAEVKAFQWIYLYQPSPIEVATGSLGAPGRSPALIVYVHSDNPLTRLTLAQLDAAFGCERLRGAPANIRTWGQLGLTGEWRDRPIHIYAPDTEEGTGRFFRHVVLNDSRMLDWEHLKEFTETKGRPATHDAGRKIIAALAVDPLGLAVAGAGLDDVHVKPLALAEDANGPFIPATRENLIARTYPLTRAVFAYVNRAPGSPLDAKVREFLAYVLSREGQDEIKRDNAYLPLNAALIRAQQDALK